MNPNLTHRNFHLQEKLFQFFDEDRSGELNFCEFACSIWNLLSTKKFGQYAFILCDDDLSQKVSVQELENLIEFMHRVPIKQSPHFGIISKFKNKYMADVPMDVFIDWCEKNPGVCGPICTIQLNLRNQIINKKFWKSVEDLREKNDEQKLNIYPYILRSKVHHANHSINTRAKIQKNKEKFQGLRQGRKSDANESVLMNFYQIGTVGKQSSKKIAATETESIDEAKANNGYKNENKSEKQSQRGTIREAPKSGAVPQAPLESIEEGDKKVDGRKTSRNSQIQLPPISPAAGGDGSKVKASEKQQRKLDDATMKKSRDTIIGGLGAAAAASAMQKKKASAALAGIGTAGISRKTILQPIKRDSNMKVENPNP